MNIEDKQQLIRELLDAYSNSYITEDELIEMDDLYENAITVIHEIQE